MWLIRKLQDPHLVVAFQKICGVEAVSEDGSSQKTTNGSSNGSVGVANHSSNSSVNGSVDSKNGIVSNGNYLVSSNGELSSGDSSGLKSRIGELSNGHNIHANGNAHLTQNGDKFHVANGNSKTFQNGASPKSKEPNNNACQKRYRVNNMFWYYMFHFGANLGNEIFYITFFPFMVWNYDYYIIRRSCAFWALYMYLGQATKDVLKIPRPLSPPVVRLEDRYALEYGLPSTHAMVGAGLPFSIFFLSLNRYEFPWSVGLAICVAWCLLVCLSRIYLGMHSFLDLAVGLIYVFALMLPFFAICDVCDDFAQHHWLGPLLSIFLPLALCICYPTLNKWSTARGDTTLILAVASGVYFASYFNVRYGFTIDNPVPPPYSFPFAAEDLGVYVLRFLTGVVVLGVTREIIKILSNKFICWLLEVNSQDLKQQQRLSIELPYKFITYSIIGFNAVFTVPIIHSYLGIARVAFHFEA